MDIIHKLITSIRSIRAELKVEAGKKIHAVVYAGKLLSHLEEKREAIMRLGRLESLEMKEKGKKIPQSKADFIDGLELYLPLKDMIDTTKEAKRLEKKIADKKNLVDSLTNKLKNKGFIAQAPAEVIQKEKAHLETATEELAKLRDQLATIG